MPKIDSWDKLRAGVRQHLIDRMRRWIESNPEVPDRDWCKDYGTFKICGSFPKTFLLRGQVGKGEAL